MNDSKTIENISIGLSLGYGYSADGKVILSQIAAAAVTKGDYRDEILIDAISLNVETNQSYETTVSHLIQSLRGRPDLQHLFSDAPRLPYNAALEKFTTWLLAIIEEMPSIYCLCNGGSIMSIFNTFIFPACPTPRPIAISLMDLTSYVNGRSDGTEVEMQWMDKANEIARFVSECVHSEDIILKDALSSACVHAMFGFGGTEQILTRLKTLPVRYSNGAGVKVLNVKVPKVTPTEEIEESHNAVH